VDVWFLSFESRVPQTAGALTPRLATQPSACSEPFFGFTDWLFLFFSSSSCRPGFSSPGPTCAGCSVLRHGRARGWLSARSSSAPPFSLGCFLRGQVPSCPGIFPICAHLGDMAFLDGPRTSVESNPREERDTLLLSLICPINLGRTILHVNRSPLFTLRPTSTCPRVFNLESRRDETKFSCPGFPHWEGPPRFSVFSFNAPG